MAKATRLIRPRTVTGDGEGLVSHAGLVWLGEVADRNGLTVGFSQVLASAPRRRHYRGVPLVQLVPRQATFALFDACAIERTAGDRQAARYKAKPWLT